LFSIAVMAMSAFVANAQNVVAGDVNNFQACREYLTAHPQDIIVNADSTVKVFVGQDGRVKRTATGTAPTPNAPQQVHKVKDVQKTVTGVDRVNKDGSTTSFTKTTIKQMSYEDQLSFINGEREAYNLKNRGLDGRLQQRYLVYGLGGVHYADNKMAPQVTLGLSHAFWRQVDLGAEVEYSHTKYADAAETGGSYDTFAAYLTARWYFLQNSYLGGSSRLGLGAAGGYMLQRTDGDDTEKHSKNYGASMKIFLDGQLHLTGGLYGLFQGGIKWYPSVSHHHEGEDGGQKFFDKIGWYAQLGLGYRF